MKIHHFVKSSIIYISTVIVYHDNYIRCMSTKKQLLAFIYPWNQDMAARSNHYITLSVMCIHWTLYIYCPVWRETWRFVPPRKFMSPESWSTTLYSTECCAVRHDRETRCLEGNTTICSPSTWLLWTNHISLFVISIIWGIIIWFYSL